MRVTPKRRVAGAAVVGQCLAVPPAGPSASTISLRRSRSRHRLTTDGSPNCLGSGRDVTGKRLFSTALDTKKLPVEDTISLPLGAAGERVGSEQPVARGL